MSRISCQTLVKAISTVQALDLTTKEQFADEIYRTQPNMLASVIVLGKFGVSVEKMDFALNILLLCFTAMKVSGLIWRLVTEDDQEHHLQRLTAHIKFSSNLGDTLLTSSVQQYVEAHDEQLLLSWVSTETKKWQEYIIPKDSDKFIFLCTFNLVNCICCSTIC